MVKRLKLQHSSLHIIRSHREIVINPDGSRFLNFFNTTITKNLKRFNPLEALELRNKR